MKRKKREGAKLLMERLCALFAFAWRGLGRRGAEGAEGAERRREKEGEDWRGRKGCDLREKIRVLTEF